MALLFQNYILMLPPSWPPSALTRRGWELHQRSPSEKAAESVILGEAPFRAIPSVVSLLFTCFS